MAYFKKGIKTHLFIYFSLFSVLPLILLGVFVIIVEGRISYEQSLDNYSDELNMREVHILTPYFSFVDNELAFVASSKPASALIEALRTGKTDDLKPLKDNLADLFLGFGNNMSGFRQIRFLDDSGKEMVRVDFDTGEKGELISDEGLQDKSNRPYFEAAMKLNRGEVHVSPINLNREFGKIEVLHRPTIRFATPLFDNRGERRGVLVFNINAGTMLNHFKAGITEGEAYLLNSGGYFLAHPDSEKEWGFDMEREDETLGKYYPEFSAALFSWLEGKPQSGKIFTYDRGDDILQALPVYLFPNKSEKFFLAVRRVPKEIVMAHVREETLVFFIVITLLLLGLIPGAYFAGKKIARPIEILTSAEMEIARGNLAKRVKMISWGEAEELGNAFNLMAEELDNSYRDLEHRAEELQIINDNLSSKKKELEALTEDLMKANRLRAQFLASVSHELRTPLNSIIGFSELLLEKSFGALNDKQEEYVSFISNSGGHLLHLINSILDISKIDAGRMELRLEKISLENILGEIVGVITPLAMEKNIKLETKLDDRAGTITADRAMLKQILYNLLSNAIKFTATGGSVALKTILEPDKKLLFSVTDSGIGIKKEDIGKIFHEFEQIDNPLARKHGGSGLGLPLGKRMAELHGGEMWVESEPGKGSTFSFMLPVKEVEGVQPEPVERIREVMAEGEGPLILVVEDNLEVQEVLKNYLVPAGYRVAFAGDGEEALKLAAELKPFCITLDIMLPKKDGWTVIRELKERPETKIIPVVIISALREKKTGFSLGALDYLTKPVDKKTLLNALKKLSYNRKRRMGHQTALIIDDDPQVVELLSAILSMEGFSILSALDGKEGIETALEKDPDLIILDLIMPGVSGFEVVDTLRKHPAAKDIPVLIFTSRDLSREEREILEREVSAVLKKEDLSPEDLLFEIRNLEMRYPAKAKMIDPLTGAYNYRYFKRRIRDEINRGERYGHTFSMMMLNLDNLSEVNLKENASFGDALLESVSRAILESIRKSDCFIQLKEDSFMVIFPETSLASASGVVKKVKSRLKGMTLPPRGGENGKITVSMGVASYPKDGKSEEELLKKVNKLTDPAAAKGKEGAIVLGGDVNPDVS